MMRFLFLSQDDQWPAMDLDTAYPIHQRRHTGSDLDRLLLFTLHFTHTHDL